MGFLGMLRDEKDLTPLSFVSISLLLEMPILLTVTAAQMDIIHMITTVDTRRLATDLLFIRDGKISSFPVNMTEKM
jgi:hypothetical protein